MKLIKWLLIVAAWVSMPFMLWAMCSIVYHVIFLHAQYSTHLEAVCLVRSMSLCMFCVIALSLFFPEKPEKKHPMENFFSWFMMIDAAIVLMMSFFVALG